MAFSLHAGTRNLVGSVVVFRESSLTEESGGDIVATCASCRKVRDASGNWLTLERYVETSYGKRFSHGLCDDCLNDLYPELDVTTTTRKCT